MGFCNNYFTVYNVTILFVRCGVWSCVILNYSMVDNVHGVVVQLHAVAAFSMVDSHERRPKESLSRVIGSLLGVMKEKGVYEVETIKNLLSMIFFVVEYRPSYDDMRVLVYMYVLHVDHCI